MKIRNGFVSNSSSSSFVLFGVELELKNLLKNIENKALFDAEAHEAQLELNKLWDIKLKHPDFNKHKEVYDMCKMNNVSIPAETKSFFGWNFNGVYESNKVNEDAILRDMTYDNKFAFPKGINILYDDGVSYLGKILADSSEYLDNGSLSLDDIENYTQELINLGFDKSDIKIYYGTRAS